MYAYLEDQALGLSLQGRMNELKLGIGDQELDLPIDQARELHDRLDQLISEYDGE